MINPFKKYPAKLLLIGEYTVTKGGEALAIPFGMKGGYWKHENSITPSNQILRLFFSYLKNIEFPYNVKINYENLNQHIESGLSFYSDIPFGYGLGSSGTLVAAIVDCYMQIGHLNDQEKQTILGQMESFFHGTSSGIDPLVSLLNKAIYIKKDKKIEVLEDFDLSDQAYKLFLLDTTIARHTEPLMQVFNKKYQEDTLFRVQIEKMSSVNEQLIQVIFQKDWESMYSNMKILSNLQLEYFGDMIPDSIKEVWEKGLQTDLYYLKLCGAGGGGMMLGLTKNFVQTSALYPSVKMIKINGS